MLKGNTYIVLNQYEANKLPKNAINVYCRSKYVSEFIRKKDINLLIPNPNKTANQSKYLLEKSHNLSKYIIERIKKVYDTKFFNSYEELFEPYLIQRLSSFLYMDTTIPKSKGYFIFRKYGWKKIERKEELIIEIEKN